MNISDLYQIYLNHPIVTTDSRNCPVGSIFFAIRGDKFDGNNFAAAALEAGAAYAVIDRRRAKTDERMLLVKDTLATLQQLAQHHRRTLGIPVVAITGTNGKTTTKELVSRVLSAKFKTYSTEGNLNNHIGVPLTLLRLTCEYQIAVVEMGANHIGEIRTLADIAQPDYGLITNIGYAHLEGFGSFEGVVRAKGELYDYLRAHGGKIFIRKGDATLQSIASGLEQISYGADENADVAGRATGDYPFLSVEVKEPPSVIHTQLVGDYNLDNVLAAVAVGRYFGVAPDEINAAIASYTPQNNRSQMRKTERNTLIIDAYNANPSSMKAAIDNFAAMPAPNKALILGDMLELGKDSYRLHCEVVRHIKEKPFDRILLVGNEFFRAGLAEGGYNEYYYDADYLRDKLLSLPLHNYHILIKGSRGMQLEKVLDRL
ncbi:MAG: UDP-N-acetylmuramoyl-tripeptide--D-alanyl-D-alanine ligase [Tannerella sp.]|jgi:UDP-N-acetylmuramoyl-tripeptide--D-alanyl-D-alanine ligase|nr:UDP-N-acetylmuramoyl-tripeptide--D-alanyl-D-alanine ligase [Tannerella sp.]